MLSIRILKTFLTMPINEYIHSLYENTGHEIKNTNIVKG